MPVVTTLSGAGAASPNPGGKTFGERCFVR